MRKIVLFGLGLSLTAAGLAGCGDPGDAAGAGDDNAKSDGAVQTPGNGDAGVDAGASSVGSLGNRNASGAVRAGLAERGIARGVGSSGVIVPFAQSLTAANGNILQSTVTGSGPYTNSMVLLGFTSGELACGSTAVNAGAICTVATALTDCGAGGGSLCTDPAPIEGVLIRVAAGAIAPTVGCTDAVGGGSGTLASPVTPSSYVASTGAGTVTVTGLAAGTYTIRVCSVDSVGNVADGVTTFVTAPGTALPANGDIVTATLSAKGATDVGAYDAYLDLTGFTDDTAIAGLRVRVNTGASVAPAAGCNVAGNFNSGGSDQGALNSVGQTTFTTGAGALGSGTCSGGTRVGLGCAVASQVADCPGSGGGTCTLGTAFTLASGEGGLKIRGLTTPPGTITSYYVRVCSVDASSTSNTANGATYVINVRDDVTAPLNGTIDASKVTYDSGNDGHIPLTSGWTDDRAVDHFVVRVNSGLTAPATSCGTAGIVYACVAGARSGQICKANSDCPNSTCAVSATLAGDYDRASVSATAAPANLRAAVPYVSAAVGGGASGYEILVLDLPVSTALAGGTQYTARVCAVDVAGNTSTGVTARITAKTGGSAQPTSRTFAALASATQETIYAVTSITQANYATASLSVQCPNPAATPTLNDSELGTTVSTAPPFAAGTCTATPTFSCGAAAGFTNQPNRCKVTTSGVSDPCPTATKKLAVAIDCDVETARTASSVLVAGSVLDNTSGTATLTLTCPNPGDTITAVTGDYGDPEVAGTTLIANNDCTAEALSGVCVGGADAGKDCTVATQVADCASDVCTATTPYDTAIAAVLAGCTGDHSCTIPQGLASTPIAATNTSAGALSCPSLKRTAAVITCRGSYATSHAVTLQLTGAAAAGDEVCISNTPLTSEGTSAVVKGSCSTGWKALTGTGAATQTALVAGTYAWTLAAGDGLKTVYIKTHDATFNESAVLTRTLAVDTIAPARSGLTAKADGPGLRTPSGTFLTNLVSWTNFLESGSGVASYKLVYTTDGSLPPTDCSAGHCAGGTNIGDACTAATQAADCPGAGGGTCTVDAGVITIGDWYTSTSGDVAEPTGSQDPFVHDEVYNSLGVGTGAVLTAATRYTYRVCATDRVGRGSTLLLSDDSSPTDFPKTTYAPGAPAGATAANDYTKPVLGGTFSLQDRDGSDGSASTMPNVISFGGSSWSNSIYVDAVTEGLSTSTIAAGQSIAAYCFTADPNPANCKSWNAVANLVDLDPTAGVDTGFAVPDGVKLTGGDGTKTYYVHARDTLGNTTANPSTISAQIKLDKTAPTNPTLTLTPGSKKVTVSWTLPTDSGSGLAGFSAADRTPYKIVFAKSTTVTSSVSAPANCSSGTLLAVEASEIAGPPARTIVQGATANGGTGALDVTALSTGFTYAYRMCVTDLVGNRSAGVVKSAKPL